MPSTLADNPKEMSPMEKLTDSLRIQNNQFEELLVRLRGKLHNLSDTNIPQETSNKVAAIDLPFREGRLMDYHYQIGRNLELLGALETEVRKIEGLI